MTLREYADLLTAVTPVKAQYVTLDEDYIRIWRERPTLEAITARRFAWRGKGCVGLIRYWPDFLSLDEYRYEDDGSLDWYSAIEPIKNYQWQEAVEARTWMKMLDAVLPYEFSAGTIDKGTLSLWKRPPKYTNGAWVGAGMQKPVAIFSSPTKIIHSDTNLIV